VGPVERKLIDLALREDIGSGDITSRALFYNKNPKIQAKILAKQSLVLAGNPIVQAVFKKVNSRTRFKSIKKEGEKVEEGDVLALIEGTASSILTAERVALNFLQRLSGIATLTRRFVESVQGSHAQILDTRKTIPGWRRLEKYAVLLGGGANHRMGLYDAYLIKDNHLALYRSITKAVEAVRNANRKGLKIEVEVQDLKRVEEAIKAGVDWVLLDNMTLEDLHLAVILRNKIGISTPKDGRMPLLEASGNVNLHNVKAVAETGVDFISIGALTHSAPAVDVSLDVR
jgi:nicotinate-nucleotide pyrophosphorylase (carboxylating)